MAASYTCVDSALEELTDLDLYYKEKWWPVRTGLKFLRTFLSYNPNWSDADEGVREHLGDLAMSIEDAFAEVELEDLADAVEQEDEESLDAAYSSLLEKIDLFKPKIREAYNTLSEYISKCQHPVTDYDTWRQFINFIRDNIGDLAYGKHLSAAAKKQFEALSESLQLLGSFIYSLVHPTNPCNQFIDLWIHLGTLAIYAARLLCSCWVDKMDDNMAKEIIIRACDLQEKIKPVTAEVVEIYFKVMKSVSYCPAEHTANNFLEFLLPMKVRVEPLINLRERLKFLVTFVLGTPEERAEDVERISSDVKTAIVDAAALQLSSRARYKTDISLYLLLQKTELLKLEIVLMELISSTKTKGLAMDTFESLQRGVKFLQTFFKHPPVIKEKMMRILTHIEAVAGEVEPLHSSFHSEQITEDMVKDALKLLVNMNLLKAEAFFMGLTVNYNGSSMDCLQGQIETLNEGLESLRKFLSGPQQQNPNDGKLIQIEGVAREAISLYYSLHSDQPTDNTINDKSLMLSNLIEKVNLVKSEVKDTYLKIRSSSSLNFPKTDGIGFIDFFLENLRQLLKQKANSMDSVKHQIEAVLKELESVKSSIDSVGKQSKHQPPELKDLCARVTHVAYQADYAIDSILLKNGNMWYNMLSLSEVVDKIKLIKAEVEEIKRKNCDAGLPDIPQIVRPVVSQISTPEIEEVVVALQDQEELIINRLTRGTSLDLVSIVGMAGLGKTTLAKKVYNNPLVKDQFHIHAWCCVSQVYRKRETLLKILSDIIKLTDEILDKSDEDLLLLLSQSLRRNKYIIVLDDVWDNQAWNDIGSAFPNDRNGSRILLTSRYSEVASEAKDGSVPLSLRPLSPDESWKLLKERVFQKECCPEELVQTGEQIAQRCKGLPLAVVAIAGLLKRTEMKVDWWKQIAEDLNSKILKDEESTVNHILELSYSHLPDELRPCFLYFGAFEQGKEIPVHKLIWLWIAEGFVRKVDKESSLEDVAEAYLMDLVARSLVMADRRGSMGRVKACRVHDILHKFCLSKVEEENFLQSTTGYDKLFPSSSGHLDHCVDLDYRTPSHSISYEQHRVSIHSKRNHFVMLKPSGPRVRSLLFSATHDANPRRIYDMSFVCQNFKLLRVLDIESINVGISFPKGIEFLDQLRYLAVSGYIESIPSSIAKLWRLETLIVKGLGGKVALPDAIWSMAMLRHLHVNDNTIFSLPEKDFKYSRLDNLVTLSSPSLHYGKDMEKLLKKCPKLRKMRCIFSESPDVTDNCNRFPVLDFLTELVSLQIFYYGNVHHSCEFNFPLNLKKLTLSDFRLPWDFISVVGKLRHLQVLKLISQAFNSGTWDMKDGKFLELKFLKIDGSEITQWIASTDHLPKLERLILRNCKKLQEVPCSILEKTSLEMIELRWCSISAENSVREVQEELQQEGVKVFINVIESRPEH